MKRIAKTPYLIAGLILFLSLFQDAYATGSFVAVPANPNVINQNKFIYEAKPGETIEDTLYLENTSAQDQNFKVYALDGTLEDAKFTPSTNTQIQQEIGSWTKIEQSAITLKSGEKALVNFQILIPANQELKSYYGGIAIENNSSAESNNVQVNTRIIVRIDLKTTQTPNPPAKKYPAPTFWEKINKTHLTIAGILFFISCVGLIYAYLKEKPSKSVKPSRDD